MSAKNIWSRPPTEQNCKAWGGTKNQHHTKQLPRPYTGLATKKPKQPTTRVKPPTTHKTNNTQKHQKQPTPLQSKNPKHNPTQHPTTKHPQVLR